jgi:hypothetical protein
MYSDQLPFARGKVFGITNSTDGAYLLGQEYIVEDIDPSDRSKKRSNRLVRIRAVRNSATIALLPKRIAVYKTATMNTEINGYTTTTAAPFAGIIDEFLPAAGVPANDICYIATKGPTLALTDIAQTDDISIGDRLVSLTAATSQATTAGRLDLQVLTGATAVLAGQILNTIGLAMTAITSANTNMDILIDVRGDT